MTQALKQLRLSILNRLPTIKTSYDDIVWRHRVTTSYDDIVLHRNLWASALVQELHEGLHVAEASGGWQEPPQVSDCANLWSICEILILRDYNHTISQHYNPLSFFIILYSCFRHTVPHVQTFAMHETNRWASHPVAWISASLSLSMGIHSFSGSSSLPACECLVNATWGRFENCHLWACASVAFDCVTMSYIVLRMQLLTKRNYDCYDQTKRTANHTFAILLQLPLRSSSFQTHQTYRPGQAPCIPSLLKVMWNPASSTSPCPIFSAWTSE